MFVLKSPGLPYVSGSKITVPLDFMDRRGVRLGRLAIDRIHVEAALNVTTVAANTIPGADMASFFTTLRAFDATGTRFYMSGTEARAQMHSELFGAAPDDPTTHGASATQVDTYNMFLHFAQPETARRQWDFAIPTDDVRGGGIEIQCPTATGQIFQTGSGATINSGTYTLYVWVREEFDLEFHQRDIREFFNQQLAGTAVILLGGAFLRGAFIYKDAQGGGTSVTTVTDMTCESYKLIAIPRSILKQGFLNRKPVKSAQDPFFNDKALALFFPRIDAKMTDHLLFPASLLIRFTSTLATPYDIVVHRIAPKDDRVMRDAVMANQVDPATLNPRIKTAGKTATDAANWRRNAVYMPAKVDLPRVGS